MIDIDPADLAARVELRTQLHGLRKDMDLSGENVARLCGFGNLGAVRSLERRTNWEVWRLQRWARGLDRMLRLHIIGLTLPDDDITSMVLRATTAFGARDEDDLHLRIVAHDLIRTRKAMFSRPEMASRCGVTEGAVRDWEAQPQSSVVRLYQRYARALGGTVTLELQPVVVAVAS